MCTWQTYTRNFCSIAGPSLAAAAIPLGHTAFTQRAGSEVVEMSVDEAVIKAAIKARRNYIISNLE